MRDLLFWFPFTFICFFMVIFPMVSKYMRHKK